MLYHFPGMSDSADLPSPSSSDYMIYFAFLMVQALMKAEKCCLNKSNVYMDLYKDVLKVTFNLDENANLTGFTDFE